MASELRYHPVLADAASLVAEARPDRLLVVGEGVPDTLAAAASTRVRSPTSPLLPTGTYSFAASGKVDVLLVSEGDPPATPEEAEWSDGSPLVNVYGWFTIWWEDAAEVDPPEFSVGDDVLTVPSGQSGIIRSRTFAAGGWSYGVRVEGRILQHRESSLAPPISDDDPASWIARPPSNARSFAATLTRAKLSGQLSDTVYSFRASRTIFRPYQFRPVIRLLGTGRLRLLIADEVGLGKTIEAGLVWTELDARNMANRVLVLCPSMLVTKWRYEMEERFGFELFPLAREQLDETLDRLEHDRLPPRFHAVCSLERMRVWPGLQRLAEIGPHFDLVIVDEAHAFRNTDTRSFALGALLADWTDALLFLSATPLNLGNDDLFNLLSLLAPGDFDNRALLEERLRPNAVLNRVGASLLERHVDSEMRLGWLKALHNLRFGPAVTARPEFGELTELLGQSTLSPRDVTEARRLIAQLHALASVVTRTRKVEIQEQKAMREVIRIDVEWSDIERDFYNAFEQWQVARAHQLALPVGFVTQMPLRLASSCLPAARDRVLGVAGGVFDGDLDSDDDEGIDVDPDVPPSPVIDLARRLGAADSKYDKFLPHLHRIVSQGRRVLLFTFSRATLAYLEGRLSSEFRIDVLHGGVVGEERHAVMRRFRAGAFDVLLASRVASEGLDFEFCSAVVNYDLPWNPMEIEQRIGRVDRFGQSEEIVYVVNFHTPGTIETDILMRLMLRIGVFKDSIGDLEPILQGKIADINRIAFDFRLSKEQRSRRLDEMMAALEEQRLTRDEVENATAYLSSTDNAEIDGLERDLLTTGRYVGQPELVLLLEDWAAGSAGASCKRSAGNTRLTLRGTQEMEQHLRAVQARGERSAAELDVYARKLREEQDIVVCLDQELARKTGESLLSATHPLTRAALGVPGHRQARFSHVRLEIADVEPGSYLVLLAVARWSGLRPSSELWAASVSLASGDVAPESVGSGLLAALAEAHLVDFTPYAGDLGLALERTERLLLHRLAAEEARRRTENAALAEIRRISLEETHARKVEQIRQRISTLQSSGKTTTIHLHEAQLRVQDRLLAEKESELRAMSAGMMTVEHLAVCTVEVVAAR